MAVLKGQMVQKHFWVYILPENYSEAFSILLEESPEKGEMIQNLVEEKRMQFYDYVMSIDRIQNVSTKRTIFKIEC